MAFDFINAAQDLGGHSLSSFRKNSSIAGEPHDAAEVYRGEGRYGLS
jgi:hypothetical protein